MERGFCIEICTYGSIVQYLGGRAGVALEFLLQLWNVIFSSKFKLFHSRDSSTC